MCLEIADNRAKAKLPENPVNITLSGQNGKLINGWASYGTLPTEVAVYFAAEARQGLVRSSWSGPAVSPPVPEVGGGVAGRAALAGRGTYRW